MEGTLQTLQIKAYQEVIDRFNLLLSEAETASGTRTTTRGQFLETLLENYENPRKVNIREDTAETLSRLEQAEKDRDELQRLATEAATNLGETTLEMVEWRKVKKEFGAYLAILKRDNLGENYGDLFRRMLQILQKHNRFILDPEDVAYLKKMEASANG